MKILLFSFFAGAALVFGCFSYSIYGQHSDRPLSCEQASGYLDYILENATENDVVIAIAYSGKGEDGPLRNKRRLFNLKTYLTTYKKGTVFVNHPENLVLASGEAQKGNGRIEIYFKGKLFQTFFVPLNKDLYVGECAIDLELYRKPCDVESQKVFYPCLDRKKGR